jgi:hypothetical protein
MLVSETHRERANAIQQMAFPLAGVVAPVLTGLVYTWVGLNRVILVGLATFNLSSGKISAITRQFFASNVLIPPS